MMMAFWMAVGLFCLATQAAAQEPKPCLSPSQYNGSMTMTLAIGPQKEVHRFDYDYDAVTQRIHTKELSADGLIIEDLYLHQQRVHYSWIGNNCSKKDLHVDFEPFGVPKNATFLSQVVLGTSSKAGHGLVVNNWRDDSTGKLLTYTDSDCLPVSEYIEDPDTGFSVSLSFFNNLLVHNPDAFVISDICKDAKLKTVKIQKETENWIKYFHSSFQKQR